MTSGQSSEFSNFLQNRQAGDVLAYVHNYSVAHFLQKQVSGFVFTAVVFEKTAFQF